MNTLRRKPVRLLIVDDSPADRTLFKVAFKKTGAPVDVKFCDSGRAAMELLFPKSGPRFYLPTVCLLDINMPAISGIDVLKAIKSQVDTRHISVCMFSSSDNEEDVQACYRAGANGYYQKPLEKADFDQFVASLVFIWSGASRFPARL